MKKKLMYEVPDVELIELKLEQTIAASLESEENEKAELENWGTL